MLLVFLLSICYATEAEVDASHLKLARQGMQQGGGGKEIKRTPFGTCRLPVS